MPPSSPSGTATIMRCHGRVLNDCRTRAPPSRAVTRSMISSAMMPVYAPNQLSRCTAAICAASAAEPARITTTRTKLANLQGEEEVHLVVQAGKVAPGQLLDPPDPVADGVDVDVHLGRTRVPGSGAGQEFPQRRQQLGAVLVVVGQQRAEQALAERAQHASRHGGQQELV